MLQVMLGLLYTAYSAAPATAPTATAPATATAQTATVRWTRSWRRPKLRLQRR